ncbi:type VI secretion system amidase effector protein Tae4 [Methylomonas montana]|uniref:type VI secretion system amidase effector protein Tae4 n=1 Tax=Methylomonas montana TaxID=3058963 RepID=UPI00387E6483
MAIVKFETIWQNYPDEYPCLDPKTGKPPKGYSNQCAMRVGCALEKSGISFASFSGKRCPCGSANGGMVAGAQELASWLGPNRFQGCPNPETHAGKDAFEKVSSRTGIIFLANYWQREGETDSTRTGDHIDLWNGSRMTAYSSWFRVHLGVGWDGVWSDFRGASRVLFWPIP